MAKIGDVLNKALRVEHEMKTAKNIHRVHFFSSGTGFVGIMNRFTKEISKRKLTFIQKRTVTSIQDVNSLLTIDKMPHPRALPIFGTKLDLLAAGSGKKLHEYIDRRHKNLGPIFYEQLSGSTKLVFISNPSEVKTLFLNLEGKYPTHLLPDPWILYGKLYGNKRGLFFMNGEEWLCNRRVMNTHLLRDDSEKWMANPVLSTVDAFIESWKYKAKNGCFNPNLESDFYRFSTDVIISILLGSHSTLKPNRHYDMLLNMFSESVKKIFHTTTKLYGVPIEWYQRFNLKGWRDFKQCVDLSLFLAKKIVYEILHKRDENNGLIRRLYDENLSDETITRIVADFVIAAGDTTAYTSLWILYLLSNHEELIKEMRIKDKYHVKYIIKESMRLYPVAPFLTRILPKDSILDIYKLKEGTPIIASIYTSGRDEKNFSQADKFLPYRWDRSDPRRNSLKNHVPSASLPFALGARSCIGRKIAMIQITELIYQIVNHFDLKCLNETVIKPMTSQVLVPNEDVKIAVSLRKPETSQIKD